MKVKMINNNKDISSMIKTIPELINEGFAVILWSPEELRELSPEAVEQHCIQAGWDFIELNSPSAQEEKDASIVEKAEYFQPYQD